MPTQRIKQLLNECKSQEAISAADNLLATQGIGEHDRATALLLRGNAYRQLGNWRMAMNSYLEAREIEPDGPAAMALDNIQQILDFYHKDLYNP